MDRRTFLRLAALSALAIDWRPAWSPAAATRSRVTAISDPALTGSRDPAVSALMRMLDRSLTALTGAGNADDAWHSLFSSRDVVGIKVNCLAGRGLSSSPPLVDAIARCLHRTGIEPGNIIVWDRNNRDLASAGFTPGNQGPLYRCFGTDQTGFDGTLYEYNSIGSLASSILTRLCSAIINVPVLKDHGITGVSLSMKNYYGAIHNPNKYHPDGGNPFIADLNTLPIIREKERLIICDGLRGQCHGGPAFDSRWQWPHGTVMAACDPVALDTIGLAVIERRRRRLGLPSLREEKRHPAYIETAAAVNGLGNARHDSIDLVEDEL